MGKPDESGEGEKVAIDLNKLRAQIITDEHGQYEEMVEVTPQRKVVKPNGKIIGFLSQHPKLTNWVAFWVSAILCGLTWAWLKQSSIESDFKANPFVKKLTVEDQNKFFRQMFRMEPVDLKTSSQNWQ